MHACVHQSNYLRARTPTEVYYRGVAAFQEGYTIFTMAVCAAGVQGVPSGALLLSRVPAGRLALTQSRLQKIQPVWPPLISKKY